jgi:ribosomal-protein-alanine N-acetyltransferase
MSPKREAHSLHDQVTEISEILKAPSEGLVWFSDWSESQIRDELEKAVSLGFFEGGQLLSFVFARPSGDNDFEITNLGTRLDRRRQGLMRSLLLKLVNQLAKHSIWLEVHEGNGPAIRLYESLGFKEMGRRKRYYADGASCVLMKRPPP